MPSADDVRQQAYQQKLREARGKILRVGDSINITGIPGIEPDMTGTTMARVLELAEPGTGNPHPKVEITFGPHQGQVIESLENTQWKGNYPDISEGPYNEGDPIVLIRPEALYGPDRVPGGYGPNRVPRTATETAVTPEETPRKFEPRIGPQIEAVPSPAGHPLPPYGPADRPSPDNRPFPSYGPAYGPARRKE